MEKFAWLALHLGLVLGPALPQPEASDSVWQHWSPLQPGDVPKRGLGNPFPWAFRGTTQPINLDLKVYKSAGKAELQWHGEITIGAPPPKVQLPVNIPKRNTPTRLHTPRYQTFSTPVRNTPSPLPEFNSKTPDSMIETPPRSLSPRQWVYWRDWCPLCQRYVTFYTWRCRYSHRYAYLCRLCGNDVAECCCEQRRRRRYRRSGKFRIQGYYG
ncbi:hypothetical protein VTI74DRAFT_5748 [Chaetomium olivicolor]